MKASLVKDDKDYNIWMLLSQIYKLIYKARVKELFRYDITPAQARILFSIEAADAFGHAPTLTNISKYTLLEPHSVSEIFHRMEKKGLIEKSKGPRNVISVKLTKQGRHAYELSTRREPMHNIMSCLSEEECTQLEGILKKLLRVSIQKVAKPVGPPPISSALAEDVSYHTSGDRVLSI
jgi:DNA-binding MarR family transcriptional regulator